MKKLGAHVLVTSAEACCYKQAQRTRRRLAWRRVLSLKPLYWPDALSQLQWASSPLQRSGQIALVVFAWPLLFIFGVMNLVGSFLMLPSRLLNTFIVPRELRSPGEKSLQGIHNAFKPVLDMPEADYIRCINDWVASLYGEEVALEKNLSVYLLDLEKKRMNHRLSQDQKIRQLKPRHQISIARELLSRDLGHYLLDEH